MIPQEFSRREKVLGLLAAAAVGAYLCAEGIVRPAGAAWSALEATRDTALVRLLRGRALIGREKNIRRAHALFVNSARHEGTVQEVRAKILGTIETLARGQSLKITDLRPLPVTEGGAFRAFLVEVEGKGTVSQLARFLHSLDNASPPMRAERLLVMAGQEGVSIKMTISQNQLMASEDIPAAKTSGGVIPAGR